MEESQGMPNSIRFIFFLIAKIGEPTHNPFLQSEKQKGNKLI
jgi:hypothetical protein